ncbi:MAG: MFS transporter [Anaerolineae bacterium]|nr:MFS transporter [Anaerolineae bacterium]
MTNALALWRQRFAPERILWIAGLGVAISMLGDLTLYVVLPTHVEDAGITLANVGLMLSANRLIRLVINSPYGVLIERIPRRRMAIPSLFIGALSSLFYTVPGFWSLLIGRLLWGAAWAGIWLSASTIALDISTDANRGRFVSRLQMWFFIGMGLSSLVGGALTDWIGYRATFQVCALVTLIMAVGWWLALPETRTHRAEHVTSRTAPEQATPDSPGTNTPPVNVLRLLITAIVLLGLNWLIFIGILGAVLPLLLEERIGETVTLAALVIPLATFTGALVAANQVVSLLSSLGAGWLSDRNRQRWRLMLGALVLAIGTMILTAVGNGIMIVTATMFGAVATSILQTQVMTLVGDYTRADRRGRMLGILNTVGDLGSAGGPLLAYALLPLIELSGIFWLATVILFLALPVTIWAVRQEQHICREEII